MEKKIGSKEVEMKAVNTKAEQPQKLTYEQLNQACAEMSQQLQQQSKYIQQMHKQMQEMSFLLQNKRVDYLLRVVELQGQYSSMFTDDFFISCVKEIEESLTIPKKEENQDTNKE